MSTSLRPLLAVLALAPASSAFAAPQPEFTLGTELYHEKYEEEVGGAKFMQEEAWMAGLNGSARFFLADNHAVKFKGRYAQGESDYTGGYNGGPGYGSLRIDGLDRSVYELHGAYEYTSPWEDHPVISSLGLGYRNLTDRLDQGGPGGYKRVSEYWYATLAFESSFFLGTSYWQATPRVAYNYLLQGKQHSYLSSGELLNDQNKGHGFELAMSFSRPINLGARSTLSVTPFFRYWDIKKSESIYTLNGGLIYENYEPNNTTKEFGLNLSLGF
nr:hypothetical protein [uncultured Pseudogulbenkiania sp.]